MHQSTKSFKSEDGLKRIVDSDCTHIYLSRSVGHKLVLLGSYNWSITEGVYQSQQFTNSQVQGLSVVNSFLLSIEKCCLPSYLINLSLVFDVKA